MVATAIIVAAGRGTRMGHTLPKQYIRLDGVPILVHTLRVFQQAPEIRDILLVVPPGDEEYCLRELIEPYELHKVLKIVIGGERRQDSVAHALKEMEGFTQVVAVHDGVRPFVIREMIPQAIGFLDQFDGVVFGMPIKETLKVVDSDGLILQTPLRTAYWSAQTPQVFRKRVLLEAHHRASVDGFHGTDDASLVERLGYKVKVLQGHPENIKITNREDLLLAEWIHHARQKGPL